MPGHAERDAAQGKSVRTMILRLAADMKGKAAPEACALLANRYPKLIRPALR